MSVVENAIAKLRSTGGATDKSPAARPEVVASLETTAEIARLDLPAHAVDSSRFIKIDLKRLRSAGFLPDQTEERRR